MCRRHSTLSRHSSSRFCSNDTCRHVRYYVFVRFRTTKKLIFLFVRKWNIIFSNFIVLNISSHATSYLLSETAFSFSNNSKTLFVLWSLSRHFSVSLGLSKITTFLSLYFKQPFEMCLTSPHGCFLYVLTEMIQYSILLLSNCCRYHQSSRKIIQLHSLESFHEHFLRQSPRKIPRTTEYYDFLCHDRTLSLFYKIEELRVNTAIL